MSAPRDGKACIESPGGELRSLDTAPNRSGLRSLLSCIRVDEVLVLQGTPLLGALFAMEGPTAGKGLSIALLGAASTLLTAHVFVLNDWAGVLDDLRDPHRRGAVFTARRETMAVLAVALLAGALLLLSALGAPALALGAGIAAASALYSLPRIHCKGVPVASSALHFGGGLLHFLLGYSVFAAPDARGVLLGSYFALVFMAGHLTHETRDSDSDRQSEIRTNAVAFGKERSFAAGFLLFALADFLLARLVLTGAVPARLALLLPLLLLHILWSLKALRAGLTFAAVRQFQWRYRFLYAAKGLWMAGVLLLGG